MINKTTDIITPETAVTLAGLFKERVRRMPDKPAYRFFDDSINSWRDITWAEMDFEVKRWRTALNSEGLKPGDRVAIWICNCKEWVIMEQAALGIGLVVVPLFCNDRTENVSYVLNDAEVKLLLLDDEDFWKELHSVPDWPEGLIRILSLYNFSSDIDDDRLRYVSEWLPDEGDDISPASAGPDDIATVVYTSGTTGHPKGVELSHRNILWNAHSGLESEMIYTDDVFLSFLPLSHTFERTVGYYIPIMSGATVAYSRSVHQLPEDFLAVRPTVLVSVPRIFERVYAKINDELDTKPAAVRRLFELTVNIGWKRFEYMQKRQVWSMSLLLWPLLDLLVAKKIRSRFGGRLRMSVVGGAPLSADVAKIFLALGIPLLQGYGMTEAGPVVSVNIINNNIPSSVGIPYRDVEVKIGEDDELLVKGPGVMPGYLNNPEATADAIDIDGWLHTGDKATIKQEHVFITGRIKEIIILANGEKVPPHDIEMAIDMDPFIEQVMIVGEARPYLAALIVINKEKIRRVLTEQGLSADDPDSIKDSRIEQLILSRIAGRLHAFPGYAKVRRAVLLGEPWTIESGLITPTLKLRRKQIAAHFSEEIHRLYEGHEVVHDTKVQ